MSNPLNKYCSEANDLKDVKDAMNKIQKLRAQMKNPTRDEIIPSIFHSTVSLAAFIYQKNLSSPFSLVFHSFAHQTLFRLF